VESAKSRSLVRRAIWVGSSQFIDRAANICVTKMSNLSLGHSPRAADGAKSIRIIVESSDPESRQDHVFNESHVLVGRHERADLRLDLPEISKRHLYLQLIGGQPAHGTH